MPKILVIGNQVEDLLEDYFPDLDIVFETNPANAEAAYKTEQPDLVILGVQMTGVIGYDVSKKIMDAHPEAKIMYVTACQQIEQQILGYCSCSPYAYYPKPVHPDRFIPQLQNILVLVDKAGRLAQATDTIVVVNKFESEKKSFERIKGVNIINSSKEDFQHSLLSYTPSTIYLSHAYNFDHFKDALEAYRDKFFCGFIMMITPAINGVSGGERYAIKQTFEKGAEDFIFFPCEAELLAARVKNHPAYKKS